MSVITEVHRLSQAKTDLKAVMEKRGAVITTNNTIDTFADILDSCQYVVEGAFVPDEDVKNFSVSGLPFTPTYIGMVCPASCSSTAYTPSTVMHIVKPKSDAGILGYRGSDGYASNAFLGVNTSAVKWSEDGVSIIIPSAVVCYFLKGYTYNYYIIGDNTDPNRHAKYFDVSADGVVSLKAEYTADGELNAELPKDLVIPEAVNGVAVNSLSAGMFMNNNAIESLTIPSTVDEIPEDFCNMAVNLRKIKNTDNIVKVGVSGFEGCKLERFVMPNLEELGARALGRNAHLVYADIGRTTKIEESTFRNDLSLIEVKSDGNITSVGEGAFGCTWSLKKLNFINFLTSVGDYAFLRSGYDYDWSSLVSCDFGVKSTSLQVNATDFWSGLTPASCENPLPTQLCQHDERWVNEKIGNSSIEYNKGCLFISLIHAYCGLKNLKLNTVFEFENMLNLVNSDLLNGFKSKYKDAADILSALGTNAELVNEKRSLWNEEMLGKLYNTLDNGGYALVSVQAETAHAVVVYGVNEKKELLFLDSSKFYTYDLTKPAAGKLKVQHLVDNGREFVIVNAKEV